MLISVKSLLFSKRSIHKHKVPSKYTKQFLLSALPIVKVIMNQNLCRSQGVRKQGFLCLLVSIRSLLRSRCNTPPHSFLGGIFMEVRCPPKYDFFKCFICRVKPWSRAFSLKSIWLNVISSIIADGLEVVSCYQLTSIEGDHAIMWIALWCCSLYLPLFML